MWKARVGRQVFALIWCKSISERTGGSGLLAKKSAVWMFLYQAELLFDKNKVVIPQLEKKPVFMRLSKF